MEIKDIQKILFVSSSFIEKLEKEGIIETKKIEDNLIYKVFLCDLLLKDNKIKIDDLKDINKLKGIYPNLSKCIEKTMKLELNLSDKLNYFGKEIGKFKVEKVEFDKEEIVVKGKVKPGELSKFNGYEEKYKIKCKGVKEYKVESNEIGFLNIYNEHILLKDYNEDMYSLSFNGSASDLNEIEDKIKNVFNNEMDYLRNIERYIGYDKSVKSIIKAGFGTFAYGPESIMGLFKSILDEYKIKSGLIKEQDKEKLKVIIMDGSYIICEEINVK
ncbi:MAG: hypothetical protein N4A47_03000 [Clostridia bacterium]|nr:hypothetical protein [Clostridia bacterium]